MPPIHILHHLLLQTRQLSINVTSLTLLVIHIHPKQKQDGADQNSSRSTQIETVSNLVMRAIKRQERPGRDQSTDIAKHDIEADSGGASSVGNNVCRDLGVAQSAKGEGTGGNDESSSVADIGILGCKEHDISNHHQWSGGNKQDCASVQAPGDEWQQNGEKATDNVWRDSVELLRDDGCLGVDGAHNGRGEESQSLNSDIIQKEDEGCDNGDWVEDTTHNLLHVELVEDFGRCNTFSLDTGNCEVLLFLSEPISRRGTVSQSEE